MKFEELHIDKWLIQSLNEVAITQPTVIQEACIPQILAGKDVIASAKTGSGKTAAFALPILQSLAKDPFGIFALVLTPTRELAFQIAEQFRLLGSGINLKYTVVVGGLDMMTQALELTKRPHIVIATPGRFVDHINTSSGAVDLKRLKFLVLDEADRLLEDSFAPDLEIILDAASKRRQTLLFSATMTPEIQELQFSPTSKPFVYSANTRYDTVEKLDQRYIFVPSSVRDVYLIYLLRKLLPNAQNAVMGSSAEKGSKSATGGGNNDHNNSRPNKKLKKSRITDDMIQDPSSSSASSKTSAIVFVGKKNLCERVYMMLREVGIRCTSLHSKLSQSERLGSIAKFKSGIVPILVTTDVGSRGLDIPSVEVVINYDLPADASDYIHRVGRTARAGRGGMALSIISERDVNILLNIENKTNKKLVEYEDVPENEVLTLLDEVATARKKVLMKLTTAKEY